MKQIIESRVGKMIFVGCITICISVIAFLASQLNPLFDALFMGLLLGMLVRTIGGKWVQYEEVLTSIPRYTIPIGIVFYGVNLECQKFVTIPLSTWMHIVMGIVLVFAVGVMIGKKMGLNPINALLISVGTAVCGASAIAIVTPTLKAKSEETGMALLTITITGSVGILVCTYGGSLLSLSIDNYALLCATTLPQTGQVKMAAASMGTSCVAAAMGIKVARTALIIPIVAILSATRYNGTVNPFRSIPWYLWGFAAAGVIFSFVPYMHQWLGVVRPVATFLWAIAMTSLGLSINMRSLIEMMGKPLAVGFLAMLVVGIHFFIGYFGMGY